MATNDKVRVSTLDDWYLVWSKMYNQLKAENASRYDTDIGKDFKTTSMLNPGATTLIIQFLSLSKYV